MVGLSMVGKVCIGFIAADIRVPVTDVAPFSHQYLKGRRDYFKDYTG